MNFIFVDTSAWCAYFDKSDTDHVHASQYALKTTIPFITSNYIVDETLTLIRNRIGHHRATKIGEQFFSEQIAQIIRVTSHDEIKAFRIFKKYRDKDFSFTDCTSFIMMKRHKINMAFAFDKHFKQYGNLTVFPC